MGKQSITPTSRRTAVPLALVFLLALAGLAAHAQTPLLLPSAIVFDAQGNLYIAETANHDIRRIDPSGNITTIAGNGTQGYSGDNGPATAAELDSPQGLALDANQNLYIADTHNQRIRKLSLTTGIITTIAGTGTAGHAGDNGPAISAELDIPTALAVDTANNLYLADTANHRIRKIIATTGTITTIAGNGTQGFSGDNGPATTASIDSPQGLALDAAGNLYLADTHNQRIRRIDATTGIITTIAGTGTSAYSGDNAAATSASISLPRGLILDAHQNLYIADTANHRIREINAATGTITTIAGNGTQAFTGDNGPATAASLDTPRAVTLPSSGLLTLADTSNQRIRQLDSAAPPNIHTYTGAGTAIPATLTITGPSSTLYGTGQLVISLATTANATGTITLTDQSIDQSTDQTSGATTLGPATLSANTTTISIAALSTGAHTLIATYSGDGTHATAQSAPFDITIRQATVNIALTTSGASAGPLTITTQVASATTGTPTGTLTLFDSDNSLDAFTLPASGQTTFSTSTLSTGTHTFTAVYGGDTNFAAATSTPSVVIIDTGSGTTIGGGTSTGTGSTPDFSLNTTGTSSQTILSGGSATFNLAFKTTVSTLSSPIALSASGLPSLATASFNPSYLPPGVTSKAFTLTIAMPASVSSAVHQRTRFSPIAFALFLFPAAGLALGRRNRSRSALFLLAFAAFTLTCCFGCGNRTYTGALHNTPPMPYTVTVTGTATTPAGAVLQHTATITLLLQQTN